MPPKRHLLWRLAGCLLSNDKPTWRFLKTDIELERDFDGLHHIPDEVLPPVPLLFAKRNIIQFFREIFRPNYLRAAELKTPMQKLEEPRNAAARAIEGITAVLRTVPV